jgi:hypothetical protein
MKEREEAETDMTRVHVGEGRAIRPADVIAQVEDVARAAVQHLPGACRVRHQVRLLIEFGQAREEVAAEPGLRLEGQPQGVNRGDQPSGIGQLQGARVLSARCIRLRFRQIRVGLPLLHSTEDYRQLVEEVAAGLPATRDGEAVVFMGHGTEHFADATYAALDDAFKDMGWAVYRLPIYAFDEKL